MPSVVIVGTGVAGATAAFALRTEGYDGRIVLIGEEPYHPYPRPPLSKEVLRGERDIAKLKLRPDSFYDTKRVELLMGRTVTHVDVGSHTVALDDGETVPFDDLILATGGRPRPLRTGHDLPSVHLLRNLQDTLRLREDLTPGTRVVVVGAGFIGAEVAASARSLGCEVLILEAASSPMNRLLPPILAKSYVALHHDHGVELRTGVGVDRVEQGSDHTQVHTTDGTLIEADVVVVGIGIIPNVELAEDAGIQVANGIVVDEHGQTSAPHVWATGDVSEQPNMLRGGRLRVEHWQTAQHHAAALAANIVGKPTPFVHVPWAWSDQYDVNMQVCGWPTAEDEVTIRGDLDSYDALLVFKHDGLLTGAVGLNRGAEVRALRHLLQHAPNAHVDASTDLDSLITEGTAA
jgi:3-phenylpropionate/trans-cinnamate dioxygenase ferredoxin reductase subunit